MPRILYVSNTANFSKFNRPYMAELRKKGWIVDYASNGEEPVLDCDNDFKINIARSPFSLKNFKGYKELKTLIAKNNYDIIHCHTPMGGVLARLAARNLWEQKKVKIIYTAHGFHFFKGAPLLNWLVYYPIEKHLSRYTDLLITIVEEDFKRAKEVMHCPVVMINGVGVDFSKFVPLTEEQKSFFREKNGFSDEDFLISIVAETNKNKNQIMLLKRVRELSSQITNLKILLIGKETLPTARKYVEKNKLSDYVKFLGYRKDIPELTGMSNVAFSASKREGLPVNIIEAMGLSIPIVASTNRGHSSLISDQKDGLLFSINNPDDMVFAIKKIYSDKNFASILGKNAFEKSRIYSLEIILKKIIWHYENIIKG